MMEARTVYFESPGEENTDAVFGIVADRAKELGIKKIIVASTTGATAARAVDFFNGFNIVAVSHSTGLREPNVQRFSAENQKYVESKGGKVFTGTHLFSGLSAAMRKKFSTYEIGDIVANTLRIFGQGMKVVCEVGVMAADAGLVRTDEDIIVIAGTGRGSDVAVVMKPAHSNDFFELKIKEILCKPRF